MKGTVAIATLGCKTNQFESAAMEEHLRGAGYQVVPFSAGADLVLVNTCTVTSATDAQSRNLIRRARRLNGTCRVVVTGCYAQVDPQALEALPGVSLVIGNEEKRCLLDLLEGEGEGGAVQVSAIRETADRAHPLQVTAFAERSRAFVQIQNGCDAFCSYCIIPYARGRSRSVVPEEVLSQVRTLIESGYPEVVLTGIHIGGYGLDLAPSTNLLELVRRIGRETSIERLRLGSLEPTEIPQELLEEVASNPSICCHFHIPLQSGSNGVLKRMNRHYDTAWFRDLVERIRVRIPEAAIGLDLIAGFPGETAAEFEETFQYLASLPFTHLHVFPFSRRPGTPAATMQGQLPGDLVRERAARLRQLGEEKLRAFSACLVGQTVEVVVESGGQRRRGLTRNYLEVSFAGPGSLVGKLAKIRVTSLESDGLRGTLA